MSFQDLPADIRKNYLISFLLPSDFLNLSCTCHEYSELIKDIKNWYRHFDKLSKNSNYILSKDTLLRYSSQIHPRDLYLLVDLVSDKLWININKEKTFQTVCKLPHMDLVKFSKKFPVSDMFVVECTTDILFDIGRDDRSNIELIFDNNGKIIQLKILIYLKTIFEDRVIFNMKSKLMFKELRSLLPEYLYIFRELKFPQGSKTNLDDVRDVMMQKLQLTSCSYKYYDCDE